MPKKRVNTNSQQAFTLLFNRKRNNKFIDFITYILKIIPIIIFNQLIVLKKHKNTYEKKYNYE